MGVSISQSLASEFLPAYISGIEGALSGKVARKGINAYTSRAPAYYVSIVASMEALLHELLLGPMARAAYEDSSLWLLSDSELDRLDLRAKYVIAPNLLLGCTFARAEQPYQDFDLLVKLRNKITHYKGGSDSPKVVRQLQQRGIAFKSTSNEAFVLWPHAVSCTEGIRWANNCAARMAHQLADMLDDSSLKVFPQVLRSNYREFTEEDASRLFHAAGVDLDAEPTKNFG